MPFDRHIWYIRQSLVVARGLNLGAVVCNAGGVVC